MRASIAFLTSTSGIAPAVPAAAGSYRLDVLGLHRGQRAIYFLETCRATTAGAPMLHVMHLSGQHAGRLATAVGWYQADPGGARFHTRLATLCDELMPLEPLDADDWALSTRVVQHRAMRLPEGTPSIRRFALSLQVDPIADPLRSRDGLGRTSVVAYLRPRAALDGVWEIPREAVVIARVAYIGVPSDTGHTRHTAVLARRGAR